MDLLRFTTAGSVDVGKSTLIGRLLYDSRGVYEDQLQAARRVTRAGTAGALDFAHLTDGLRAEREHGITIDVVAVNKMDQVGFSEEVFQQRPPHGDDRRTRRRTRGSFGTGPFRVRSFRSVGERTNRICRHVAISRGGGGDCLWFTRKSARERAHLIDLGAGAELELASELFRILTLVKR